MSTYFAINAVPAPAIGRTPNPGKKLLIFAASLVAMYASMWLLFGSTGAVILCISVFFHELGHFLAFRMRGYTAGMFFVPFLGAAVYPDDKERFKTAPRADEVFITMMGPFFNVVLVAGSLLLALFTDGDVRGYALASASINAVLASLNLLPFGILDGGHIARAIFISSDDHHDRLIAGWLRVASYAGVAVVIIFGGIPFGALLFVWGTGRKSIEIDRYAHDHPRSMSNEVALHWGKIWALLFAVSVAAGAVLGYWGDYF